MCCGQAGRLATGVAKRQRLLTGNENWLVCRRRLIAERAAGAGDRPPRAGGVQSGRVVRVVQLVHSVQFVRVRQTVQSVRSVPTVRNVQLLRSVQVVQVLRLG